MIRLTTDDDRKLYPEGCYWGEYVRVVNNVPMETGSWEEMDYRDQFTWQQCPECHLMQMVGTLKHPTFHPCPDCAVMMVIQFTPDGECRPHATTFTVFAAPMAIELDELDDVPPSSTDPASWAIQPTPTGLIYEEVKMQKEAEARKWNGRE
jgi:hypothetical protein